MTSGHKMLRFMIPAVLALTVLLATGCDLLTNSDDDPAPADPSTLILPAGTVVGASGEYLLVYRGAGGEANLTDQNFKRFSVSSGAIPSIQLGLADVEDLLVPSTFVGNNDNALFNNDTGDAPTITPTVNMMRLRYIVPVKTGGWSNTERITRANQSPIQDGSAVIPDGTYVVDWWYADGPATVSGEFYFESVDRGVEATTNFQLQRGWNRIIYEIENDTSVTVSTGQEPANLGWHLISIAP